MEPTLTHHSLSGAEGHCCDLLAYFAVSIFCVSDTLDDGVTGYYCLGIFQDKLYHKGVQVVSMSPGIEEGT